MKDEEIVRSIVKGNTRLFSDLVGRYQNKVYSTAYYYTRNQEDARDLTQEIFIKIYNNLSGFRQGSAFSTWLYRIAVNRCIDWTRKRKIHTLGAFIGEDGEETDPLDMVADSEGGPEDLFLRQESAAEIQEMVSSLPEIYSTAMILYFFEDLSPQEIADILDIPRKTVETRLFRGKKLLKTRLLAAANGGECYELQQT